MAKKTINITITPGKRLLKLPSGVNLREVLLDNGISLRYYCGGEGTCGKCRVRFTENAPFPNSYDKKFFSEDEISLGWRLACKTRVSKDAAVEIPGEHRAADMEIYTGEDYIDIEPDPELRNIRIGCDKATIDNQVSDMEAVLKAMPGQNPEPELSFLRKLPRALRESDYTVDVSLFNDIFIDIRKSGGSLDAFGIAVDLGTTTIAASLFNLGTGVSIGRSGALNPQTVHGADVVSRIQFASESPENLDKLRMEAIDAINKLAENLCKKAGISARDVGMMSLAGNSTMEHLVLGIPPNHIPVAPYVPVFKKGVLLRAEQAGLKINPSARFYVFPTIGGFVGGDTVSDILATGFCDSDDLSLMIDIGTNGEIVLGNKNRIIATSAAAGPAFEGRNISCGMRAEAGAVDSVTIDGNISIHTIGEKDPVGVCGTGMISLVASFLDHGLINAMGGFDPDAAKNISGKSAEIEKRFRNGDDGLSFSIARSPEQDLLIHQKDIRELQLAKGAISAGITLLMKEYNVAPEDIDAVYLAGAFGNYISPEAAIRIGLIPDVSPEKIMFMGDAALTGASAALLRKDMRERTERISTKTEFIELAGRNDFQDVFAESMIFT